ncbi:4'-phosphopantetheinyl transferase superfamily protein, partial [Kitasatospora sp. LaBMicrA B282]|uniref:4'-phosphopantetheinyl transferase superfamily protein n=1 Tax=Kitasatospora sp. LaBMicrA B282 TaxID=3420949 RepID=UPI003D09FE06
FCTGPAGAADANTRPGPATTRDEATAQELKPRQVKHRCSTRPDGPHQLHPDGPHPSALSALADRFPLAGELDALLRDTERAAVEVIGAARPAVGPTRSTHRSRLHVSCATMPYLRDHCFFRQRPDWPDLVDRWPVVPATTIVQHLLDAAERAEPGRVAVGVREMRFTQWVPAATPMEVELTLQDAGPDLRTAAFGEYARGIVELTDSHDPPPAPWPVDPTGERVPELTAAALYEQRWMFHGPAFQGLTELTAVGERHVRGVITVPTASGALLDNVGQLLGYWIMASYRDRTVVFPVGLRRLRRYGPPPPPGTQVQCHIRVTALTATLLEADVQLRCGATVWAEVHGWQDRRFDSHPATRPVERFVERNTLSTVQPGGWLLLHERWPDLASRDLVMRNHLGSAERARHEQQPPRGRRAWLLGRIAVKDAVRRWLWERGEGPVYPAEIEVRNDPSGRPRVVGLHGRELPALEVSLAHRHEAAVALVRPARAGGPGVGIDLEEVTERPAPTAPVALDPAERDLLAACRAAHGGSEALWFTRFWAAKEAAAKAEGTGLRGRPGDFTVVRADPDELADPDALLVTVAGPGAARTHHLRCTEIANPADLPARRYVVAWTTDDATDHHAESDDRGAATK